MNPIVLCITGAIGSGKSEVASRLAARLGWRCASFGSYVRSVAHDHGLPGTRDQLQALGECMMAEDPKRFCLAVLAQAGWQSSHSIIVEGVRHMEALKALRSASQTSSVLLVYLDVSEATRAARIAARDRNDDTRPDADAHSTEVQVREVLRDVADLLVDAEQDLEWLVTVIANWASRHAALDANRQ